VVMRCLAKDPNARYANANDLADALDRCLKDGAQEGMVALTRSSPDQETRPSPVARVDDATIDEPARPIVERRRAWLVAAALLLLLGVVGGIALRGRRDGDNQARVIDGGASTRTDVHANTPPIPAVPAPPEINPIHVAREDRDAALAAPDAALAVAPPTPRHADAGDRPSIDSFRLASEAFIHGNYPLAAAQADLAIQHRQGGHNGQNARILLGQVLLAQGGSHARAFDVLCTAVGLSSAGSGPRRSACRKIRAASGCPRPGQTSDLVATCCDQCEGEQP
jgi:hypothetical protein